VGEIFVYCMSKSDDAEKRRRFKAVACVEILEVKAFCRRVERALPWRATFPGRPGHKRVGQHVQYYRATEAGNPRWALPDLIAASKLDSYAWQDEFRLVFSITNALAFENVRLQIVQGRSERLRNPSQHHNHELRVGRLSDIAVFHDLSISRSA
jgi:hypothetical protein